MQYRARRIPSDADVTVIIGGLRLTVPLRDVSDTGLKLGLEGEFPPGTPIRITSAQLDIEGEVSWSSKRETGVRLSRALSGSELGVLAQIAWAA